MKTVVANLDNDWTLTRAEIDAACSDSDRVIMPRVQTGVRLSLTCV